MYYGVKGSNQHKIMPAPNISMSVEMQYANDTIVGYTYNLTMNGIITGLDLRNVGYGQDYEEDGRNIGSIVDAIERLRKRLNENGNILYITDAQTGAILLKAKGGILRSFTVNESPNGWSSTAPFSATIDFDALEINNAEGCNDSLFNVSSYPSDLTGIVNNTKYKLKSFSDNWTFDFPESVYDKVAYSDVGEYINMNNVIFKIQYHLEATGKTSYVYQNEDANSSSTVLPAWIQAKNFVQKRLVAQVGNLIDGVLKTYNSACTTGDTLDTINIPSSSLNGLISSMQGYSICNENISCESSESQGTFSVDYSATITSTRGHNLISSPFANHTITKSVTHNNDLSNQETRVSINGTIQGMVPGGLITGNDVEIQLPDHGSVFVKRGRFYTKYYYARLILDQIYNPSDYGGGFGLYGKRDFKPFFKDLMGISAIGGNSSSNDPYRSSLPHPISFNLTEDKVAGTINYTAEYSNTANRCGKEFNSITIESDEPTKVFASLEVPNGGCPIIQELGTSTLKKITVNISGKDNSSAGRPSSPIDLSSLVRCGYQGSCYEDTYLPPVGFNVNGYLTDHQYTSNPITGEYQITLGYICPAEGNNACTIY